jgi:hypothetical protein
LSKGKEEELEGKEDCPSFISIHNCRRCVKGTYTLLSSSKPDWSGCPYAPSIISSSRSAQGVLPHHSLHPPLPSNLSLLSHSLRPLYSFFSLSALSQ